MTREGEQALRICAFLRSALQSYVPGLPRKSIALTIQRMAELIEACPLPDKIRADAHRTGHAIVMDVGLWLEAGIDVESAAKRLTYELWYRYDPRMRALMDRQNAVVNSCADTRRTRKESAAESGLLRCLRSWSCSPEDSIFRRMEPTAGASSSTRQCARASKHLATFT